MKLEVKNLRKSFGDTEVLHGISFSVSSGKALGLLGRNGAGKTTTIRILMDVFKANEGEVLIDGKTFDPKKFQIGYLPEERGLYPKKKILDQIVYLAVLRGMNRSEARESAKKWLSKLGIEEYANRLLETLSKGNQQKVQLAQTLVCSPEIVILDEPFSGLDPVNSKILEDVVKELIKENKIVIFSSHQMNYVEEFCEDIVIINHGEVAIGGNLKDIKKDFGEKRLILSANNYNTQELKSIAIEKFKDVVYVYDVKEEFIILELVKDKDKKDLLRLILESDIDVEKFGDFEPTLNDIFVLKAGDK
ncbi:ATP-binding cassette domain-containing protein [uncultured Clostridium sp.]|uniref:ABC transporter ATP-binding protein n=1 Tax=uncultured Clostridium sp. TaxID=59620 RepID=UPI0025CD9F9B|nr:ATP-binding cassette domain-containing protein [uncultured Clostridium sp.]